MNTRTVYTRRLEAAAARPRAGFTLAELLVGIGIFLILATISLGAFNAATDGDKGPAAASSFRSWIEGAKSRAAKIGRPVGIRPIIPETPTAANFFGHAVSEFEYVASAAPIEGTLAYMEQVAWVNGANVIYQWRIGQLVSTPVNFPGATPDPVSWTRLNGDPGELDLLEPGMRIEIPRDSGRWFTIAGDDPRTVGYLEFGPANGGSGLVNNYLTLVEDPAEVIYVNGVSGFLASDANDDNVESANAPNEHSVPTTSNGWSATVANVRFRVPNVLQIPYRLELGVDVLENERTLSLPGGMFLDLDASKTPTSGFPTDSLADGQYNDPYTNQPIMFSPTGEVIGDYQQLGVLTFFLGSRDELNAARALSGHPQNIAANVADSDVYDLWTRAVPPVRAEGIGDPQAITVLPKTGFVQKSVVNPADIDGDGFSDAPFAFRLRGDLDR